MAKDYKDATPAEKYNSAVKQDADKSQPGTMEMLKNLGSSIMGSKQESEGKLLGTETKGFAPKETVKKKAGGKVGCGCKKMSGGGSASARADGCAVRGKTKGRMV
jgi:hypothetical protein